MAVTRVADAFRWEATVYRRDERDVLRQPLAAGQPWENALDGTSHGVELLVERRRARGLSGWVAYSFAKTRYNDIARGETFWADFDQRHGMNLFAAYHLSERSNVAVYVEVLNVLNRTNVGLASGTIGSTGEAVGFTERLMPRLPPAGIAFEF